MKIRMNILRLLPFALTTFIVFSVSCSDLFGPSISNLTVTGGLDSVSLPLDNSDSFYIDSPQICCSVKLERAHKNTAVTSKWVLTEGELAAGDNPVIYEDTVYLDTDGYAGFTFKPSMRGFARGEYRIDVYIDGKAKASGNFTVQKDATGSLPQIKKFTLRPEVITGGQSSQLCWQVSGATSIRIVPSPGKVETSGEGTITPTTDAVYTLYAVNRSGCSSSTISIKVMPAITGSADLQILDFWNTGNILFYRICNKGTLASPGTFSALYKNGLFVSEDFVGPLSPGEERVESFAGYHFSPRFGSITGSALPEGISDAVNMRICLNQPASCDESDFDNNCFEHNFGPLLSINLLRYISKAEWINSSGALTWPMGMNRSSGWVTLGTAVTREESFPNALLIYPGTETGSYIQASIGIPYGEPYVLTPITVPFKCKLTYLAGLTSDATGGAGASLMIGIKEGDSIEFLDVVNLKSKGKPEKYEVDLSKLAGRQVELIVRAEAGETLHQGSIAWIDPVLAQDR